MRRSWFPIFLVAGLLGLLFASAFFQYRWLGKISEDERERTQIRVKNDTERFAEDFNREIQNSYFNFQTETETWKQKNWTQFNERYDFWRERAAYPDLIKNFYYWDNRENAPLLMYNAEKREFAEVAWTEELKKIQAQAAEKKSSSFQPENFALIMPIQEIEETLNRIIIRRRPDDPLPVKNFEKIGFLVIALDENAIKNRLLPDLAGKYFSGGEFHLAVSAADGKTVYQTGSVNSADASARLFEFLPDNFVFFSSRQSPRELPRGEVKSMVFSQRLENKIITRTETETIKRGEMPNANSGAVRVVVSPTEYRRTTDIPVSISSENNNWTLTVQHAAGSLDQHIGNTLRQNLAVSFGILALLAVSVILIFVSTQRAKMLAQRQIEFVSSVSHEFRTPLAVIYSASENLADGVAKESAQISRYGDLIKSEGRKLSAMVEQILEFAGANSGKKKYDLRETDAREIIETAISECHPLIEEKNFTIEREISENLPKIAADKNALSQALQNLIANSIKYSNGSRWLKIAAQNGGKTVKITVEDKGLGIAAKDLKHVFEPFYRAKSVVDEQIHGNGLGLSLVKKTVEAHGGKVSVESEIGKGSKFTIILETLPKAPRAG